MTLHSRIFRSSKYRVKRKLTSNDKQVNKGSFIEKQEHRVIGFADFIHLITKIVVLLSFEALILFLA